MIDPGAERAPHRQLADMLRDRIDSGDLAPGDRLPSEQRLGQEYDLGREAVRRALRVLRDEGLVATRSGYGWYVREPAPRVQVKVPRGARLISRPATADERLELEIEPGGPAWVTVVTIGGRSRKYASDRIEFTFS